MRYINLTTLQLLLLTLLLSVLSALLVALNSWYLDYRLLPEVHVDGAGACIKVINFENGHAFNCNDVNVILRRYRSVAPK